MWVFGVCACCSEFRRSDSGFAVLLVGFVENDLEVMNSCRFQQIPIIMQSEVKTNVVSYQLFIKPGITAMRFPLRVSEQSASG